MSMKRISALAALVACGLIFICACSAEPGPEKTFHLFVNAMIQKQWGDVWDYLSYKDQKQYEETVFGPIQAQLKSTPPDKRNLKDPGLGVSVQDVLSMKARDFFYLQMEKKPELRDRFLKSYNPDSLRVSKVTVDNDVAKVKLQGSAKEVTMVREGGKWRVCFF